MDERDRHGDSREVERAFGRYAERLAQQDNRLANIERALEYLSTSVSQRTMAVGHRNGNGKERFLTVSNVLSSVATVLLIIVGAVVNDFRTEVRSEAKFLRDEIYTGRERDLKMAIELGQIKGNFDGLNKREEAVETEVRDMREKWLVEKTYRK